MRSLAFGVLVVALVGCAKKAEPTAAPGPKDRDRLQGVWAVESVEYAGELTPEARKQMTDSRLHIRDDRFALGEGEIWEFSTFVVDSGREPKGLILSESDPDGKPLGSGKGIPKPARTRGAIYKFDGDKLVLAFLKVSDSDSVAPPADFKAEPGQNVVVLRLVKTNEEPRTKWDVKPQGKKK